MILRVVCNSRRQSQILVFKMWKASATILSRYACNACLADAAGPAHNAFTDQFSVYIFDERFFGPVAVPHFE